MVQLLWKIVWQLLKKVNIELPYDPAIPLLGMYPKELKTDLNRHANVLKQRMPLFTTALFSVVKRRK